MLAARLLDTGSRFAGAWNFGCDRDEAVDVVTLAELVTERFGGMGPGFIVESDRNDPAESTLLRLDSTKAFVELGWKPHFSVEEAILKTVAWYREFHRSPGAIRAFTDNQIAEYAEGWTASSPVRPALTPATRIAECV
jgi:CDP-glucose 4,6-dehydratase